MIRKLLRAMPKWVCTSLTVALILWLTLAPHPVGDLDAPLLPGIDKAVHAVMFGWLTLMLCLDIHKTTRHALSLKQIYWSAAASSLFGILIEYLQLLSDLGRSFEAADIVADCTGAVVCATSVLLWERYKKRQ